MVTSWEPGEAGPGPPARAAHPERQVVIRRLPPGLTKEQLEEQLHPLPAHDYFEFFAADLRGAVERLGRAQRCDDSPAPRKERRANKDRPTLQLYDPGARFRARECGRSFGDWS
ncbi:hypothetical protein P7K49_038257 [Saguinus oedipus]|uniref:UPF3 domain-containing protein n=1 Tax=Saguinus oedipus TaxID=9490 RepID=A0ABQ9TE62_SAGOE|nr:hypothetical protein P7K49_038257 [Saguinus oedipus]